MAATLLAQQWKEKGRFLQVFGHNVFYVDEGDKQLPVIVILHGYPSASFDYKHVLPILTKHFRVVVHDHIGFGYSDKPKDYSYSLLEQAEVALKLYEILGLKNVHLVAHDYGTSVATEILARRERANIHLDIETVTLSNGSMLIELADLRYIQRLLRHPFWGPIVAKLGSEMIYVHQMKRLWHDRSKVDVDELKALWLMGSSDGGRAVLPKITQYLHERVKYWHRWIGALKTLDVPAHILWAENDPVAVYKIGQTLHEKMSGSNLTTLKALGHYPMLEDPGRWSQHLMEFIFAQ